MANNFSVDPLAGRRLPNNWAAIASANAVQADADYQHRISNAWRGPLTSQNHSHAQAARLGNQPPAPAAPPKRNDARSDARFDTKMTLVSDNEDEQIWRDFNGSTIVIKKRK
jgi:hypothetical protein